jgi:DNA polymerase-3 subunit alpha
VGDSFTHLHLHTEFSMLDGAARVADVVRKAVEDGQPAIGITDHGNMYGILDFYTACRDQGIKPILGTELYQAYEKRTERPAMRGRTDDGGGETDDGRKAYYHLTALAENQQGYRNLIQLSSRAYLEGYYRKPKVDWELLEEHHEGLIVTSGCLGGQVLQALVPGPVMEPERYARNPRLRDPHDEDQRFKNALEIAGRFQDIFGRDNFFIEIQDHGIEAQVWSNPKLIEIARQLRAPLLATNDSHYTDQHDAKSHDALLCVQTGSLMADTERFKFHGDEHYLKTAAEMRRLFAEIEVACDNSLWIAERCEVEIEFGKPQLPAFPLPEGFATDSDYLRHLCFEGAADRWGRDLPDSVTERLVYELQVIADMGFSSYFLIVGDLIRHARDHDIRVGPGRGSAAGCAVAYCLRITDLDPIKYDLLFERFLNPSRISMPDIDMDFDSRYRDEMIRYAAERYGRDHVAQIVTFGTIKARQAVRDAARVLGHPYDVGDRIAKAMPPLVMGRDTPLWACMDEHEKYADGYKMAAELREMYAADPSSKEVIDVAKGLEGLRRQDGIHAAAVVITKEPLTEYLPIQRKPESGQDPEDAPVVTQYEMHGVEELGLLKMDFLGLRNLDVISDTLGLIEATRGVEVDIDDVDLEDGPTYALLQEGQSIGVFQLEGGPMRALMRSLAPDCFEDVAALVALYRPGPMAANMHNDYADRKNGRKPVEYLHPDAEEVLVDTYGLMVYQESVMRVAQRFAGYSLAEADNLRKACGKKIRELIQKEREKFVDGCDATGYGRELGNAWFDIIEPFADYAFNKSHAYGYGLVAYQTAYLKANYPTEYLAALLTSVKANLDKAAVYLNECRIMGIEVVVPDVNRSDSDFTPVIDDDNPSILFGLSAVRNVGEGLVAQVVAERKANGPYVDFYDFCDRVDLSVLNKRTIESLVKAGGFDSMGHPRQGLLMVFEGIIDLTLERRRKEAEGQFDLFASLEPETGGAMPEMRDPIPDIEFDKKPRLAFEKEMLGLYVSDHPLLGLQGPLRRRTDCTIAEWVESGESEIRTVGGVVTALQRKWTRKGDLMAVFVLEDLQTSVEVMVFPKTMAQIGHLLVDDAVVGVKARLDSRDDTSKLIAMEVELLELVSDGAPPVRIQVPPARLTEPLIDRLKGLLTEHPGESQVFLHLGDRQVLKLSDEFCVDSTTGLLGELRVLLGPDALVG